MPTAHPHPKHGGTASEPTPSGASSLRPTVSSAPPLTTPTVKVQCNQSHEDMAWAVWNHRKCPQGFNKCFKLETGQHHCSHPQHLAGARHQVKRRSHHLEDVTTPLEPRRAEPTTGAQRSSWQCSSTSHNKDGETSPSAVYAKQPTPPSERCKTCCN